MLESYARLILDILRLYRILRGGSGGSTTSRSPRDIMVVHLFTNTR